MFFYSFYIVLQYCLFRFFPMGWGLFWHFWLTSRFPPWGIWSKILKFVRSPPLARTLPPRGLHWWVHKGLKNRNKESKVSLYVNDTTTFIHDDPSAVALFALLYRFSKLSGLRINTSKTEGLWLGLWKNRLGKDEPFGISWPKQYASSLGVVFAYETHVDGKINFDERLVKMNKTLKERIFGRGRTTDALRDCILVTYGLCLSYVTLEFWSTYLCLRGHELASSFSFLATISSRIPITTTQILLPALNFNWSIVEIAWWVWSYKFGPYETALSQ